MKTVDSLFLEKGINGFCIAGECHYVPSKTLVMSADVESVSCHSSPAVFGKDVYQMSVVLHLRNA